MAPLVGADPAWILEASGIKERRYAADDDTVAGLGLLAAQDCLQKSGTAAADLGMILVASGSSERFCPGPASQIAASLGLTSTSALDIPVASCGSLIALSIASRLAPELGSVLVIGAEIMSRRIERTPEGKDTAILFGNDQAPASSIRSRALPASSIRFYARTAVRQRFSRWKKIGSRWKARA